MSLKTDRRGPRNAHAAQSFADRGVLGRLDRLDARRDGFVHLRARAHARADRAAAAFGLCRNNCQCRARRIDPVRPFPGGLGSFVYLGPDRRPLGRTKVLAATIFTFAIFTGLSAAAKRLGASDFPFHCGFGIGGEWALAGTYVAEAWPEDRRKMGAGHLQTGYYAGFFLAAALNYTIGVHFGWRAMFLTGAVPVVVAILILLRVQEPRSGRRPRPTRDGVKPLREIFGPRYRRRTWVAAALVTIAIVGLWAGAVYEPSAVIQLAQHAGLDKSDATKTASWATGLLSIGTILGCLVLPVIAERIGRRKTLAIYLRGWRFRLPAALAGRSICPMGSRRSSRGCSCSVSSAATSRSSASGCPSNSRRGARDGVCVLHVVRPFCGAGVNFLLGARCCTHIRWACPLR